MAPDIAINKFIVKPFQQPYWPVATDIGEGNGGSRGGTDTPFVKMNWFRDKISGIFNFSASLNNFFYIF